MVVLFPGLRAGLPRPQKNVHQSGAPKRRPPLRGRRRRVPGLQPAGLPRYLRPSFAWLGARETVAQGLSGPPRNPCAQPTFSACQLYARCPSSVLPHAGCSGCPGAVRFLTTCLTLPSPLPSWLDCGGAGFSPSAVPVLPAFPLPPLGQEHSGLLRGFRMDVEVIGAPAASPFIQTLLQYGGHGPAGLRGRSVQPPAVGATISAHVPAPAQRPPQVRTSVSDCTRRRHYAPHRPAQVLGAFGRGWEHQRTSSPQLGLVLEHLTLSAPHAEGWSPWSEWGICTEDGAQSRSRRCEELVPGPTACAGNSSQSRPCPYSEIPGMSLLSTFLPSFPP